MDRFFRGLIAGITGGIAMNLWSLIAVYILNWPIRRFIDWAAVLLYGRLPGSFAETSFALLMHILWTGTLGIIFAYMIPLTTSRGYLLKGAVFGIISGFIIYAMPTLLQTPILSENNFLSTFSNHIGGLVWGLTTAQMLRFLETTPLQQS